MSFTIGSFTYTGKHYLAQPFGYEETDVKAGMTARKVRVSALYTAAEWASLISAYNTWRTARISDPDSKTSNSVGTTVAVTISANTVSWSAVACWYSSAPSGEQSGAWVQGTVELVDAAQALQVLQKSDTVSKSRYYFGTYTLGSTTIDLLRPPQTYDSVPQMSLTAGGQTYITGPLTATRVLQLEGDTTAAGWTAIQSWYESTITSAPASAAWFPMSAPSAVAEADIVAGVRTDRYTVSITLGQAK